MKTNEELIKENEQLTARNKELVSIIQDITLQNEMAQEYGEDYGVIPQFAAEDEDENIPVDWSDAEWFDPKYHKPFTYEEIKNYSVLEHMWSSESKFGYVYQQNLCWVAPEGYFEAMTEDEAIEWYRANNKSWYHFKCGEVGGLGQSGMSERAVARVLSDVLYRFATREEFARWYEENYKPELWAAEEEEKKAKYKIEEEKREVLAAVEKALSGEESEYDLDDLSFFER